MTGQHLTFDATPEEMVLFLSEGEEQLELLSQDILRLENEGDTNTDVLQEIFRAAHTLKGSSGAIGHQRMARLTHALETVLDQVRHHTLPISTRLIDLLLQGLDTLRVLLEEVTTLVESDITIDDLCVALNALAAGQDPAASPTPAAPASAVVSAPTSAPAAPESQSVWQIDADVAPQCALPAVRALQVLLAAAALGEVIRSDPPMDVVEAGKVANAAHVTVWLAPADPADLAQRIHKTIGNISEISIASVTAPTSASAPAASLATDQWLITTALDSRCQLPAVRALQVVMQSSLLGDVQRSEPTLEMIEATQVTVSDQVRVWVRSAAPAAEFTANVHKILGQISEVQVVSVTTGVAVLPVVTEASLPAPAPVAAQVAPAAPAASVAPAKPAEHQDDANRPAANHAPRMVRIDVERLDALMNLIGELVIDRTRLARISSKIGPQAQDPILAEELTETCRHLARISDDLQDEVMRSRMLPIESVFSKFPRFVRDLSNKVNKKIDFIVEGKDTELDRSVAEQIGDPIIHLLRNSIDHGIESAADRVTAGKPEAGQVRLAARHEENQIVIDIEDDGKGISADFLKNKAVSKGIITPEVAARMSDREALELIFASGFSTAEQISDISGRGVGMDIVRTNVERLNGTITVETEAGQGTRFTVRLPLTLAIIRALLVAVNGQTYAIPLTSVVEALRVERDTLRAINGHEAIELRGQVLPLIRLKEYFATTAARARADREFVVAVRWGERRGGLIVDALIGEQEIVIKSLGHLFRNAQGISGGAVLGDGQVAPIMDVPALIKHILATERGQLQAQEAVA